MARPGRPSKFKPEFVGQARKLAEAGLTDHEIATFFEVNVATFYRWQAEYPELRDPLKAGKEVADERVTKSLYHRAIGYSHEAVKIFMPAGAKKPVYAPYIEHVPPDTVACIFWLKNRRPQDWRANPPEGDDSGPPPERVSVEVVDASIPEQDAKA